MRIRYIITYTRTVHIRLFQTRKQTDCVYKPRIIRSSGFFFSTVIMMRSRALSSSRATLVLPLPRVRPTLSSNSLRKIRVVASRHACVGVTRDPREE